MQKWLVQVLIQTNGGGQMFDNNSFSVDSFSVDSFLFEFISTTWTELFNVSYVINENYAHNYTLKFNHNEGYILT